MERQLHNPVALFGADNNGVIIDLPSIAQQGAASVSGTLVFGIGTQANNGLGAASVLTVGAQTGYFTTFYDNRTITRSFVDSGSNALFFRDTSIPNCTVAPAPDFYCPASTLMLSAVLQGTNGVTASVNFAVANANALVNANPSYAAFNNLASGLFLPQSFDWGLPFFFGRRVFVAIEGMDTPGGPGPYTAF